MAKKFDLEAAKAWYSSPEYQQWLQASARASGGGITGFDVAKMNAPMEIKKAWEKKQEEEKRRAAQAPAPAAPAPAPAPSQNDLVLGKYPKVPSPNLPPLPQGTVTLPSMAGGTLTLPQMPQGGLTMPPPMQMNMPTMNGFAMNNAGAAPAPAPAPAPASAPSAPADPAVAAGAPTSGWGAQVQHSGLNMQSIQDAIRNRMADARARAQTPEGRADMMKSAVNMMKPQQVTPSPMLGTLPDPFAS
jgi:hypothetical protein